jgi:hypothetical protein
MPTAARPARSLLVLALVVNLLAASAPASAYGAQRADRDRAASVVGPSATELRGGSRHASWTVTQAPDRSTPAAPRRSSAPARVPVLGEWTTRPKPAVPEPRPTAVPKQEAAPASASSRSTSGTTLRGRNRVWIPALGINRSVTGYACSTSSYPGNRVYRWGCAGANNVYLFGHAHSVFRPLHDAYVSGRLRKGMKVFYAASDGRVGTYSVSWWKVTRPENGAWAYAAQRRPSMTLQTCVGARSQYRLIVRLMKVG